MDAERKLLYWICLLAIGHSVLAAEWEAVVVRDIVALTSSCVVVPCTFKYPGKQLPTAKLRGLWHYKDSGLTNFIYHEIRSEIVQLFQGRTRLLGNLGDRNCTLEIDKVSDLDNGPFCFRIEIPGMERFSFKESCVNIKLIESEVKPTVEVEASVVEGEPTRLKCFVRHTCPSHPPKLSWTGISGNEHTTNKDILYGNWEVESILVFTPSEKDDHEDITCTVAFHGEKKKYSETKRIYVKRKSNPFHIVIPVMACLGSAFLFGGLAIYMRYKYKKHIQDLSGNENGMWNRLSRMSRRRSLWSRFSRRPHVNTVDLSVGKTSNNSSTISGNKGFSKPRCPSPKSEVKSVGQPGRNFTGNYNCSRDVDVNIYGNV